MHDFTQVPKKWISKLGTSKINIPQISPLQKQAPKTQEGKVLSNSRMSAFALSLQGASHQKAQPPIPCQDYSDLCYLEQEGVLVAAVADGVGSCVSSHWGSYIAVKKAMNSVKTSLASLAGGNPLVLDQEKNGPMGQLLRDAFHSARKSVEEAADAAHETVYNFQSTLTVVVFDGENLFFGHAGDGGVVVQTADGQVELVTARIKGDEANSVYPLQSGEKYWTFERANMPVAGFVMATDGVLDAFAATRPDYFGINYNHGIYYPFMEPAIETLAKKEAHAPQEALDIYRSRLLDEDFRSSVADDLTLLAAVSHQLIETAVRPRFNKNIWNVIQTESQKARLDALNHPATAAGYVSGTPQPSWTHDDLSLLGITQSGYPQDGQQQTNESIPANDSDGNPGCNLEKHLPTKDFDKDMPSDLLLDFNIQDDYLKLKDDYQKLQNDYLQQTPQNNNQNAPHTASPQPANPTEEEAHGAKP